MTHDLLLTGGDVMDPGGGHIGQYDVAVSAGRIAAVGSGLPRDARQIVDVSGKLVTPGLIDMHTHIYGTATYWGIDPDPIAWYTGVTTWVDAGSAGAYTIGGFPRPGVHVAVLLNISGIGLAAPMGEARDLSFCDVDLAVAAAREHGAAGIKVRMDRYNAAGLEPLRRAVEAAGACDLPVMVHIGAAPPAVREMLPLLRTGDIITHCASGIAGDPAALKDAYQAGVLFDIGHGAGGFAFDVLEAQLEAGMPPHTISSDLHGRCLHGPVFDLPTTMAKALAAGLSLHKVVEAATIAPAKVLGLDGGTLAVGATADIAVFTVQEGSFELVDAHGQRRRSPLRLRNEATYLEGKLLMPRLPAPPQPWIPLNTAQREALRCRERAIRDLLAGPLVGPDDLDEQFPRASAPPFRSPSTVSTSRSTRFST